MQVHRPALPLVADLHLKAQDICKLSLKRFKIGIDRLERRARWSTVTAGAGRGTHFRSPGPLLGLPDGQSFLNDLARQLIGIFSRCHRSGVAHADIAFQ